MEKRAWFDSGAFGGTGEKIQSLSPQDVGVLHDADASREDAHPSLGIVSLSRRWDHGGGSRCVVARQNGERVSLHGDIYLPDLWEEDYWDEGNVISPAICSLMGSRTRGNLERRVRAYERIASAPVEEERCSVLLNMVDQYLCLNDHETVEWNAWMEKERSKEVRRMLTQWHVKGIEEGKTLGKAEGKAEGKRETLLRLMRIKFGQIPDSVETLINGINNLEMLDELADRVLFANSLEEMKLDSF